MAVDGVDLRVDRGQVHAVLGPNGAGKSTLVEAIGGVIPSRSGTVTVAGRRATVLQTPGLADRSVRANVELALAWWGVPRAQRRPRALAALGQLNAEHLAGRRARTLSGGEQRRVHLARGVAVAPDLLLLDEPFAGLDPATHAALTEDTASALRATGAGVVVVLHDRRDAWAMADRISVMIGGTIAATGTPREVLAAPPTAEVARFLGYDGELESPGGVLLTRPAQVLVDPAGELRGVVERVIGREDGAAIVLLTPRGRIRCVHPDPTVVPGDEVAVKIIGGVEFPA
jgi:ABC-type sugar transport system ATPase subunit